MAGEQLTIALALVAGLVSFVSPCVLALVPVYLAFLSETASAAAAVGGGGVAQPATRPVLAQALLFVAGFSVVFVLLGISAGLIGARLFAIPGVRAFPRSAAGVATLYYAGISEGKQIDAGLAYVERFTPGKGAQADSPHYYYGHYYAAQAMFLAGGDHWGKWYPAIREELIARQGPDGSWTGEVSPEYCTAMALIVLQMPNRYLPVFSGKGAGS